MSEYRPIKTPFSLYLRRFRYQFMPIFTLIVCGIAAGFLWSKRGASVVAVGEANAIRVTVNCKSDGVLAEMPRNLQLFDYVKAGDVVAQLDNSSLEAQITKLQSESQQMKAELDGLLKKPAGNAQGSSKSDGGVVAITPTGDVSDDNNDSTFVPRTQAALRIAIATREARVRELEQKIANHDLKAPISGVIVEIHRVPGQAVIAGHPIVTIAADKPDYIVSYIRSPQQIQPIPGTPVDIRRRTDTNTIHTRVDSVGPQLEKVPEEQLRDHRTPEWGVPVHIVIPPGSNLRPGEVVDLFFKPNSQTGPRIY